MKWKACQTLIDASSAKQATLVTEGVRSELSAERDSGRSTDDATEDVDLKEGTEIDSNSEMRANLVPLGMRIFSGVMFVM